MSTELFGYVNNIDLSNIVDILLVKQFNRVDRLYSVKGLNNCGD